MIYALASVATDPFEMLSRSRKSPPFRPRPLSRPLSPSSEKADLKRRNTVLLVRPYLHIDCIPFLTPEILPIVTDARARVRAKLHLHTGRIVPFRVQRISLVLGGTRPLPPLPKDLEKRFVITRRCSKEFCVASRFGMKPRTDRQELIESLSAVLAIAFPPVM